MRKNSKDFQEIEILKERQRLRILEQEMKIKSGFREINANLTGPAIANHIRENMFGGYGLAFKLGYLAVAILTDRARRKKKK